MNDEAAIPASLVPSPNGLAESRLPGPSRQWRILIADDDEETLNRLAAWEGVGEPPQPNSAQNHRPIMQASLCSPKFLDQEWANPMSIPEARPDFHKRVLIADDDSLVRGSLAAVLESEGYVVHEARNGREAVTGAIEHLADLILLDLNMPHWDGWTAFSQLDRVTPLLPVIVITARPNQYEKAVRLGVDAFMEKPLNIAILISAIKRLTSEDKARHVRRITDPAFVTQLLSNVDS